MRTFVQSPQKTKMRTHITAAQRYEISALKQVGCTQAEIAKATGVPQSAISRELQRNRTARGGYNAHAAQQISPTEQARLHDPCKFTGEQAIRMRDKGTQGRPASEHYCPTHTGFFVTFVLVKFVTDNYYIRRIWHKEEKRNPPQPIGMK
jgi:hypothetical protein